MQNLVCKCDVCGVEKGDANGWFVVEPAPWDITITPWQYFSSVSDEVELQHICGQECLHKRVAQWLEEISRPTPANSQEVGN